MRSTRSRKVLVSAALALAALALVLSSSCTKEEPAPPAAAPAAQPSAPAPAAPPPPPAEAKAEAKAGETPGKPVAMLTRTATISGEVTLEGTPPQMQPLKRGVDPVCAKKAMNDEQVLSKNGKLENVVVWVSEGAPAADSPPAAPAKL